MFSILIYKGETFYSAEHVYQVSAPLNVGYFFILFIAWFSTNGVHILREGARRLEWSIWDHKYCEAHYL